MNHEHNWEFKYQVSYIPYNFNTYFCDCGIKKVEREAFEKIEECLMSPISQENRDYAEKIRKMQYDTLFNIPIGSTVYLKKGMIFEGDYPYDGEKLVLEEINDEMCSASFSSKEGLFSLDLLDKSYLFEESEGEFKMIEE